MMKELNEEYGLNLDTCPDLSRTSGPAAVHSKGKAVIVGASHMRRAAVALIATRTDVTDLSSPGWTPTKENLQNVSEFLSRNGIGQGDCLIIDLWSNSAFLGTDELGFPKLPLRSAEDRRYHILGKLQTALATVFVRILEDTADSIAAAAPARIILIAPFPAMSSESAAATSST